MAWLLNIRERIFRFTRRFELYVMAAIRFVIAFAAFTLINTTVGFQPAASAGYVAVVLAAICAFLPSSVSVFFSAALILIHFYALSLELTGLTLCLFLVMFFLYYRFAPRKGMYIMLTPMMAYFRIPFVMPVATGLIEEPVHVISSICGLMVYFLLKNVRAHALLFETAAADSQTSVITLAANQIFGDREMYLYMTAFVAAVLVVYLIRRTGRGHCRETAVAAGALVQLVIISCGTLLMGGSFKAVPVILGCAASGVIGWLISVGTMSLDYKRTEHLVYEDDEYSYYVKAVPKTSVTVYEKQVTTITGAEENVLPETSPLPEAEAEPEETTQPETPVPEAGTVEPETESVLSEAELAAAEKIFENALRENIDLDEIAEHVESLRAAEDNE